MNLRTQLMPWFFRFFLAFFYSVSAPLLGIGQITPDRHFTMADGLPSNTVYHVLQDRNGFMWFATDRGVCRYDGDEFKYWSKEDGLIDNEVFALYEDYKGRIWCISQTQQLTYIVSDSACSYEHNAILSEVLNQYGVKIPFDRFGVKLTNEDTLTVNVSNLGTLKIAPDGTYEVLIFQLFDTSTLMYPNRKVHMVYDHVNFYLVRGLPKKNKTGRVFHSFEGEFMSTSALSQKSFEEDSTVWSTFGHFSYVYSLKEEKLISIVEDETEITDFKVLDDIVIMGNRNKGASLVDRYTLEPIEKIGFEQTVSGICVDHEENLWISYDNNGVLFYQRFNRELPGIHKNASILSLNQFGKEVSYVLNGSEIRTVSNQLL
jgi:hypothetical protein